MATILHSALSGTNVHEPKGIASATSEQVYEANGAASGSWKHPYFTLNTAVVDVSAPSTAWVVTPWACTIEKIYSVIDAAITAADCNVKIQIGGVDVTNSAFIITVAGSGAGVVDSATPTALNAATAGQAIAVVSDGASTTTSKCTFTLLCRRTA